VAHSFTFDRAHICTCPGRTHAPKVERVYASSGVIPSTFHRLCVCVCAPVFAVICRGRGCFRLSPCRLARSDSVSLSDTSGGQFFQSCLHRVISVVLNTPGPLHLCDSWQLVVLSCSIPSRDRPSILQVPKCQRYLEKSHNPSRKQCFGNVNWSFGTIGTLILAQCKHLPEAC
jgi:hypothetical protein